MNYFEEKSFIEFSEIKLRYIKTRQEDKVFYLTLNRPEKRNAFTPTMVKEIAFALEYAEHQSDIWCAVIEAEGSVFCSGMDLNVFQNPSLDIQNDMIPEPAYEITLGNVFNKFHKPSIAKVQGSVYAGGFLLIGGCTFVVANENCQFSLPEVKRGIFPMQVMASLLKIMPSRKVLEMCILGKTYSATEAQTLGLVTKIATEENLENEVNSLIISILENSPFAIQNGMYALQKISSIPEYEHHLFLVKQLRLIQESADANEGINAFREKRKPIWNNK